MSNVQCHSISITASGALACKKTRMYRREGEGAGRGIKKPVNWSGEGGESDGTCADDRRGMHNRD